MIWTGLARTGAGRAGAHRGIGAGCASSGGVTRTGLAPIGAGWAGANRGFGTGCGPVSGTGAGLAAVGGAVGMRAISVRC